MLLRMAGKKDSDAMLAIYAPYIDTAITFECRLPTREEFAGRIADILSCYPCLICQEGERVVGYAYAHRHMEREAYQWNAELSIYLDEGFVSQGRGKRLYSALIEIVKLQGVRTAYAGITQPNEKSVGLHRKLGFTSVGVYRNTGYKCGRWHDVEWFEKRLAPTTGAPEPVLPIGRLPDAAIQAVLQRYSETYPPASEM